MRIGCDGVVAPAQLIDADAERARRGDGCVLLSDRAGGRVSWVGIQGECSAALGAPFFVGGGNLRVHRVEAGLGHEDLATHFEQRWRFALQFVWNCVDGSEVGGYVFSGATIAAGRCLDQTPTFVDQRDRQTVDLRLGDEGPFLAVQQVGRSLPPAAQLIGVERVSQREHAQPMFNDGEGASRRRPNGLRGAVG